MEQLFYILPRGLAIGILISAPMGPIGMFVIQRTLSKGRWPAFFFFSCAAVSDLIYCLLTGLGLSFVTDFIEAHQSLLQVIGGAVLAAFGIYLFRKNPTRALKPAVAGANNFWKDIVTGFALTFSNPLILFFIIGLFARFNFILPEFLPYHYITAYLSIFIGALIWWYLVTLFVNAVRSRFNVRSLWLVNRIIGGVLIIMAVFGIILAVKEYVHSV